MQESYQKKAANLKDGQTMGYDEPTDERVAAGLSEILGTDMADILKRCQKESYYEILAKQVEGETEEAVRAFITDNHLSNSVYLVPDTKRYYPYSDPGGPGHRLVNSEGALTAWSPSMKRCFGGRRDASSLPRAPRGWSCPTSLRITWTPSTDTMWC